MSGFSTDARLRAWGRAVVGESGLDLVGRSETGETMTDVVAVRGVVATRPRHVIPKVGAPVTIFRLVTGRGQRAEHNWYTVTATHQLAVSAAGCVAQGDPLVVSGRLRVRDWEGEPEGVTAEIEADAIGHDLNWGSSVFTRFVSHASLVAHDGVRGDPTAREP